MNEKIFYVLLALLLFSSVTFAEMIPQDLVWNSMVGVVFDKENYLEGEAITGKVSFVNAEKYPAIGAKAVLQFAQGIYSYPSQLNSKDNVIGEQVFDFGYILPNSKKELLFSFPNPGAGDYRVDSYAWVMKSKAIGASNIFYNPAASKKISVEGVKKQRAVIDRLNTSFEGSKGPIGFPVVAGTNFSGNVIIKNGEIKKDNLKLGVTICEWALPFCKLNEKLIDVGSIQANENKTIEVSLVAPTTPSAYEINLVLYDGAVIDSIFKNRVIVSGGTAKIRKAFITGIDTRNYSATLIIAGSPDHFTYPDFDNFDVAIEIYQGTTLIEEKKETVKKIKMGEIIQKTFILSVKDFTSMCTKVSKNEVIYEKECFASDINAITSEYEIENPKSVLVRWTYDEVNSMLFVELTKEIINAQVSLFNSDKTLFKEMISTNVIYTKNIFVQKQNLFLAVNDFDAKTQQLIPLNFELGVEDRNSIIFGQTTDTNLGILNQKKCEGNICGAGTICSTAEVLTIDGKCCYNECILDSTISPDKDPFFIPLIFWIALILLVIAIVMVYELNKRRQKNE